MQPSTRGTQFDVTPEAIAARKHNGLVESIMHDLCMDMICVYTDVDGAYNDNYVRVRKIIAQHIARMGA